MAETAFKLRIRMDGTNVATFDETSTFSLGEKVEERYTLVDTDGVITLNYSNLTTPKVLVFIGSGAFTVRFNDGVNDFDLVSDGSTPTIIPISASFLSAYPTLQILTTSTTDITVDFKAYGETT